jgi:hypothetical protein
MRPLLPSSPLPLLAAALGLLLLAPLPPLASALTPRLAVSGGGTAAVLSEAAPGATAQVVVSVDPGAAASARLALYWDGSQLNVTADAAEFVAPGTSPHAALGSARDDSGVLPGCVCCRLCARAGARCVFAVWIPPLFLCTEGALSGLMATSSCSLFFYLFFFCFCFFVFFFGVRSRRSND